MSIQIVEIAQPSVIDTVAVAQPSTVAIVEVRQGPAGTGGSGSATWGGITGTLSAQTDLQTALNLKAPLASPALTGTPTAPTAATTTSTTQVATTAFVQQELASGVTVARNLEFLAHNGSGATIAKGSIVYINGAVGGVPRITKSQANNNTNSARTIGFVKADIANGSSGFVIIEGELLNVSTADSDGIIGAGIPLYLSPTTPGAFTRTKPSAPQHLVYVGVVVTASTGVALDGKIIVGIQNGYELNEIHDVSITSPAAGQVIKRNAGNTLWVNESIATSDVTGLGTLATQNGTFSGDSSGTNTGDQDLSVLLPRLSRITVSGTTPAFPGPLVEQPSLIDGKRWWLGPSGSYLQFGAYWYIYYFDGVDTYSAFSGNQTNEPWEIPPGDWFIDLGTDAPVLTIDTPALLPVNASGTIALSADQQGRVAPFDMTGLGSGVATALALDANAANGFPTANSAGRTALGSGATGDTLFTAVNAGTARTTLGLATTDRPLFAGLDITYTGSTYAIDVTKTSGSRFGVYLGDTSATQIGTLNSTKLVFTTLGNSRMEISTGGAVTISSSLTVGGFLVTTPATRSGPGALSVTASSIALTTTGVADALTLANGTNGQILTVCHVSRGGGTGTAVLTPTTKNGYTTITFTATGDSVSLQYHTTGGWHIIGSRGVTIA